MFQLEDMTVLGISQTALMFEMCGFLNLALIVINQLVNIDYRLPDCFLCGSLRSPRRLLERFMTTIIITVLGLTP